MARSTVAAMQRYFLICFKITNIHVLISSSPLRSSALQLECVRQSFSIEDFSIKISRASSSSLLSAALRPGTGGTRATRVSNDAIFYSYIFIRTRFERAPLPSPPSLRIFSFCLSNVNFLFSFFHWPRSARVRVVKFNVFSGSGVRRARVTPEQR